MEEPRDDSPVEENFNDLSQPLSNGANGSSERRDSDNGQAPKAKRCSACTLCRKRKLKCDGARPACSTCSRLQHSCSYDEVRKKSGMFLVIGIYRTPILITSCCVGPKRGYVKLLEARLAQVETLLKTSGDAPVATSAAKNDKQSNGKASARVDPATMLRNDVPPQVPQTYDIPVSDIQGDENATAEETYPWEMISLGLDEPLPIQPVVDELNQIYFDKFHPS